MDITFEEKGEVLIVGIKGRLVASTIHDMRDLVIQRMSRFNNILFDLSQMNHIDSSGLGTLVQFLQRTKSQNGTVKLASLQPHPKMVFNLTKVFRIFEIFDSVDEAYASFPKET